MINTLERVLVAPLTTVRVSSLVFIQLVNAWGGTGNVLPTRTNQTTIGALGSRPVRADRLQSVWNVAVRQSAPNKIARGLEARQRCALITRQRSSIEFISFLAARSAVDTLSAYTVTNGGVDTTVEHSASEPGPPGARVNAIVPSVAETDISNSMRTGGGSKFALGLQALKRLARAEDIALTLAFFTTGDARWIVGNTLSGSRGAELVNKEAYK